MTIFFLSSDLLSDVIISYLFLTCNHGFVLFTQRYKSSLLTAWEISRDERFTEKMEEERAYKAHVVVLPFYGQGHLNPILQFSKRLASKGLKITVTTVLSVTKTVSDGPGSITFEHIYDDCTEGGFRGPGGYKGFIESFEASGKSC